MTVGEVWSDTDTVATYLQDQLDLAFEFSLADATLRSAVGGSRTNVDRAQQKVLSAYQPGQYATFLANHDQNRTRSRLLDDEQAKLAATLQLTFPGVPFIYYGEEIGMQGGKPDENIRRPMQWTAAGGFTTGKPWEPYYEEIGTHNVAGQAAGRELAAEPLPRLDPAAQRPRGAAGGQDVAGSERSRGGLCAGPLHRR